MKSDGPGTGRKSLLVTIFMVIYGALGIPVYFLREPTMANFHALYGIVVVYGVATTTLIALLNIYLPYCMREAGRGLTISEIAEQLLIKEGVGEIDDATRRRIRNSVDSTLRQKALKGIVEHDGAAFARRWRVASRH